MSEHFQTSVFPLPLDAALRQPQLAAATMSSRMVSAHSGRAGGNQRRHRPPARTSSTPALQPLPAAPAAPAVAIVEDEPSGSGTKRQ